MKTLIIDRKKWLRGEGDSESYLLRLSDEKMCCLGIYLESCGIERARLLNRASPAALSASTMETFPEEAKWLICTNGLRFRHPNKVSKLMEINDESSFSEEEREVEISEIFLENGIKVEFIN